MEPLEEEAEQERAPDVDGAGGERKTARVDRERLEQLVAGSGADSAAEGDEHHLGPGAHPGSLRTPRKLGPAPAATLRH